MSMLAVDASRYTVSPPPIAAWQANGVGLVICQAHPAGYGQERSLGLMRACRDAGMPWDAYIYGYLAYVDWLPGALDTLDIAAREGLIPRKLFLDVEDVDSGKDWSPSLRIAAVERDLGLCDAWLLGMAKMPNTAIYSAAWYWRPYMANTLLFGDRQLWCAQYDNVADTNVFNVFGGWSSCRIKQYAGSQPDGTDLDVLSAEEEAELGIGSPPPEPPPDENPCAGMIVTIADIADRLGDQILAETNRKQGMRKLELRRIVAEMHAERVQAIGERT